MTGFTELFFVCVILFVIFGATAFPRAGEAIGRAIYRKRERERDDG